MLVACWQGFAVIFQDQVMVTLQRMHEQAFAHA